MRSILLEMPTGALFWGPSAGGSHKTEFSFLNCILMVPAGRLFIFWEWAGGVRGNDSNVKGETMLASSLPPHRYHGSRRIEHAKILLANLTSSVTEIGLTVGFSETSSFSAAFRKATGLTPSAYRRGLA